MLCDWAEESYTVSSGFSCLPTHQDLERFWKILKIRDSKRKMESTA